MEKKTIKVFGSLSCPKCKQIKKKLEDKGVEFEYTTDIRELNKIIDELESIGGLIETFLPIVVVNKKQIEHKYVDSI